MLVIGARGAIWVSRNGSRSHGHPGGIGTRSCCSRRARKGDVGTVVESAGRITVGDDLNSGIDAVGDIEGGREGEALHAEIAEAGLEEGGAEDGVEGIAGVVSHGDEHLNIGLRVSHLQSNLPAGDGPWSTLGRRGVEAAAGELVEGVFVGAAGFGEFEGEVGGGEGGNCQEGSYRVLHIEVGLYVNGREYVQQQCSVVIGVLQGIAIEEEDCLFGGMAK